MDGTKIEEIDSLAAQLETEEQLALLERIARRLRVGAEKRMPRDLYGIYRDRVPTDFDIDSALHEVRSEWLREQDGLE